jgi:hypothetical protein
MKLRVDRRQQLFSRRVVSAAPGEQEFRDVGWRIGARSFVREQQALLAWDS